MVKGLPPQPVPSEEQHIIARCCKSLARTLPPGSKFFVIGVLPPTPETWPYERIRTFTSEPEVEKFRFYLEQVFAVLKDKEKYAGKLTVDLDKKEN